MFKFYEILKSTAGRNNSGSITVRHRGSATIRKRSFNYFNFKIFNPLDFSPNHVSSNFTTFVKLNEDNSYTFILSKNSTYPSRLYLFKPGTFVCNIESYPGSGPKYVRAKYARALVIRRLGTNSVVRLPSGEIRKFKAISYAYPSLTDSFVRDFVPKGKAGVNRNLGFRPSVRGCAINPVDHPHGGRTGESRPSVSPWAVLTKGYRTRFKPKNKDIVYLSVQEIKNRKNTKFSKKL
jgi:large subunit ribosomal protein L2